MLARIVCWLGLFCQLDSLRVTGKKGTKGIFLIYDVGGFTMGGATSGHMVLGGRREKAEQALKSKLVSRVPPWPLL